MANYLCVVIGLTPQAGAGEGLQGVMACVVTQDIIMRLLFGHGPMA